MTKTVWYGEHEIEPGSAVHKRLVEEGAHFTREPVEFVDPDAELDATDYESMTVEGPDGLKALAEERGLDVEGSGSGGAIVKADLVAALEADDADGGTLGG